MAQNKAVKITFPTNKNSYDKYKKSGKAFSGVQSKSRLNIIFSSHKNIPACTNQPHLILFGPLWPMLLRLVPFGPVWPHLVLPGPAWPCLDPLDPFGMLGNFKI